MLFNQAVKKISYIKKDTKIEVGQNFSKINTEFFVDHSDLKKMMDDVITEEAPWLLGSIEEGWEWFAFTFHDQDQIALTSHEIDKMVDASDRITHSAYSKMQLGPLQSWAKHAATEARWIFNYCNLKQGDSILDFGCGTGRHAIEFSKMGINVTGVDYIEDLIRPAQNNVMNLEMNRPRFIVDDCRNVNVGKKFDAVICLYDVIGTYADNLENIKIIKNIFTHLKSNGLALISVMNYELTEDKAKYIFSFKDQPNLLLNLPASQTMAQTGNIFNPDYYMIDKNTCVVYRKEQFTTGKSLPIELLVRDRRYRKKDIEEMCRNVGLQVLWSRYVQAGNWEESLARNHSNAKEILLLCKK